MPRRPVLRTIHESHYDGRAFCGGRPHRYRRKIGRRAYEQHPQTAGDRRKRLGAGGTIAANRVAKATSDGYTILIHHIGMATAPALYRKLPFNPITDLEPIGLINEVPMTLVAKQDFPPKDLKELIAYVKANKDKVNYANAGIGAASHLCGMLFMSAIQTEVTTVPYNGTGPP